MLNYGVMMESIGLVLVRYHKGNGPISQKTEKIANSSLYMSCSKNFADACKIGRVDLHDNFWIISLKLLQISVGILFKRAKLLVLLI